MEARRPAAACRRGRFESEDRREARERGSPVEGDPRAKPGAAPRRPAAMHEKMSAQTEATMTIERRSKPRPVLEPTGMSNVELDAAIRELKITVDALIAERRARQGGGNMQFDAAQNPNTNTPT